MDKLGIEPKLLFAQIINFTIIIVVLTKLLYKPILTMLEKRRKEIEEGLSLSQKMREEEEKMKSRKEKLIEEARKEARVILEEAKKHAKEVEKDIVAQAHGVASEVIAKGKSEVELLHLKLSKNMQREAVELAAAMTKRLLSSILSSADQHKLIQKHLKELETKQ